MDRITTFAIGFDERKAMMELMVCRIDFIVLISIFLLDYCKCFWLYIIY